MHAQTQKQKSSFTPTSIQKKSNKSYSSPAFSVQHQTDTNSSQQQEIPSYSRNAADVLAANVMRSMAEREQGEETVGDKSQEGALSVAEVVMPKLEPSVAPAATVSQPLGEIGIQRHSESQQEQGMEEGQESDEMLSVAGIQTKLTVGAPGDRYEQEADAMAAQVMRMSIPTDNSPQVQRFGEEDNPVQRWSLAQSITPVVQMQVDEQVQLRELVQRAFKSGGTEASGDVESRLNASKGGGSALAPSVRAFMEPRFGADFSAVRVHTGGEAVQMNRELGAQAFTHGSDVYFGAGKSPGNNELTAHELTHVVQQTGGQVRRSVIQREGEQSPAQSTAGFTGDVAGNLDILYKEAEVAQKELYEQVTQVASETKGEAKLPSSLKGRERAMEKVMADYKGDASKLVDIARGSIVYNSYADLMGGLESCDRKLTLVREKNRFAQPTPAGYRDILLNVKLSNGHIAELQLHLTQILAVKSGAGHKIYEEVRKIEAAAQTADRALTSEESAKIKALNAESKALYDQALASAGG